VKITLDWLVQRDACATAREAFARRFPEGATYVEVQAALHAEHRADWSWWLVDAIYRDLLENPAEVTTQSVGAHVDISNKIIAASPLAVIETPTTDAARIGSSGDAARIGSSGYAAQIGSSGDDAQIGSSGDAARIGSSGDAAQIGSSGYAAQIGSSGDDARIGSSGDDARIGSLGDDARIGSSGDDARIGSSGDAAQIGSSGDAARIGSSGYAAQIGSSGDDARIVATGENATIACAGIGARVKAGRNGCFALTWYDGNRNRIVVGYVGEDGIKADTWYRVEAGKLVEAA
jgi:hypothetical protein